ncbi:hypothetical protein PSV09DRAFT_1180176 [Bipolaris maydis]|nr:hypothetical protein PSV09DRAFT_1180176 [Bipolaris maydis]
MDRRNSDDNEPSRRSSEPDVFDDDNEIDPSEDDFMPSVSDGFRPANASETWHSDRQDHDRIATPQRQTSTSKPNSTDLRRTATRNSTAKVYDPMTQDGRSPLNRGPSQRSPLGHTHRDSVSSTASFATTSNSENPFETGPSHPYGMYPQLSMARPLSVATSSTERQPHRSMSLQRPTHPYAMYSQSGIVDEEPPEEPARPPAPPVQSAIPVGFPAPLLPSVTPARLPPQRPETQTGNVAPSTSTAPSSNHTIPAEPSDSSSASFQPQVTGQNGSLFDAVPISAPSGMASIPTGPFALPMGIPQESTPGCLTQANQFSAWSCKMTFAPLVITVNQTTVDGDTVQVASMGAGPSVPKGTILYGLQTPTLDKKPLSLVLDLDFKAYGPAYHFSARYDKLVILPPEQLNLGSAITPRQEVMYRQRFEVKPGDYPWYCYWNDTYIEGYIYVQDNSTAASFTSFPTEWPTPTPSTLQTVSIEALTVTATTTDTVSVDVIETAKPTTSASAPASRRDTSSDDPPSRMPPYPRTVKIEERRLANSPQPYCQQMVLLDNGQITTAPGPNDSPIRIWLQEADPSYEEFLAAQPSNAPPNKGKRQNPPEMQRRADPPDACHCQWMFS